MHINYISIYKIWDVVFKTTKREHLFIISVPSIRVTDLFFFLLLFGHFDKFELTRKSILQIYKTIAFYPRRRWPFCSVFFVQYTNNRNVSSSCQSGDMLNHHTHRTGPHTHTHIRTQNEILHSQWIEAKTKITISPCVFGYTFITHTAVHRFLESRWTHSRCVHFVNWLLFIYTYIYIHMGMGAENDRHVFRLRRCVGISDHNKIKKKMTTEDRKNKKKKKLSWNSFRSQRRRRTWK